MIFHPFFWNPMGSGVSNLDETSQVGAEATIGEGLDRWDFMILVILKEQKSGT